MCVSPYRPKSPRGRLAYTFLCLTVFGLPADVVAASLGIDPSEVEKISALVGPPLYASFLIII
jgi:hypothetical protein